MGELIRAKQPCPCGRSSDAYEIYTDGSYCYSCNKSFRNKGSADHLRETPDGNITYVYREWRGVTAETMKHFGVLTKCIDGKPWSICFPTIRSGS